MMTSAPWVAFPNQTDKDMSWVLRKPTRSDGQRVHDLVAKCAPLDENSEYCNFLQSIHFRNTCVMAEEQGECVGFISAYQKPDSENELFIWQVAVHPNQRGRGLAFHMLQTLLSRQNLANIDVVETTITQTNQGSWALFKKLDRQHGTQGEVSIFLDQTRHFDGEHDSEYLYRIPLSYHTNS